MGIHKKYLGLFSILLVVEFLIALFVKDGFIRPYVGDILVIILMYTFIRGIVKKAIRFLILYLFLFASLVEVIQYLHIGELLNLGSNTLASIIIGTTFDVKDIICYLIASFLLLIWERNFQVKSFKKLTD